MAAIEPYLVEVILQVARMRRPINATAGLHLANSMIKGTKIEQQLTKWKLKHVVQTRQQCTSTTDDPSTMLLDGDESPTLLGRSVVTMDDEETTGSTRRSITDGEDKANASPLIVTADASTLLGKGYWNGFMKRHKHVVRCKRSVKFEFKRVNYV